MRILEFGDKGNRKLVLIHGFQSPYQIWEPYIEHYKRDFHILIPVLPGHDPDRKEDFISFADTAEEFEKYVVPKYGRHLYAVYGMSMGGVLAAELWQSGRLELEKVVLDGTPLMSMNGILKKMMIRFYLDVTHKAQQRDKKTLEQAAKSICPQECLEDFLRVLDHMSDATIVNYINDLARFELKEGIHSPDTKIYFYHGTTVNELLAKRSAKFLSKNHENSEIKCFDGKGHCENALLFPEVMMGELDRILL